MRFEMDTLALPSKPKAYRMPKQLCSLGGRAGTHKSRDHVPGQRLETNLSAKRKGGEERASLRILYTHRVTIGFKLQVNTFLILSDPSNVIVIVRSQTNFTFAPLKSEHTMATCCEESLSENKKPALAFIQ